MVSSTRSAFLGAIAALAIVPSVAGADPKKHFACRARLVRVRDNITVNQVQAIVEDGGTGDAIDGTWTNTMPRHPQGLYVKFHPKDGAQVDLAWEAEEGLDVATGQTTGAFVDSKNSGEDPFPPNAERVYDWAISGEPYHFIVSVNPA